MVQLERFDRYAIVEVLGSRGTWAVNHGLPASSQLWVRASVHKSISPDPNKAVVQIANLGRTEASLLTEDRPLAADFDTPFRFMDERVSRQLLPSAELTSVFQRLGYLKLRAGPRRLPPVIFEGTVESMDTNRRTRHTPITSIKCRDGGFQTRDGFGNKVFPQLTPLLAIVKYLVKTLGLAHDLLSFTAAGLATAVATSSVDCSGNSYAVLRQIARGFGVGLFIDDGTVVWVAKDGYRGAAPTLIGPGDVIGDPERRGSTLWRIRLGMGVSPVLGARVVVATEKLKGVLRADALTYTLSNRGGRFEVVVELRNLDVLQSL